MEIPLHQFEERALSYGALSLADGSRASLARLLVRTAIEREEALQIDPLTGLLNKRSFIIGAETWRKEGRHFGIILGDLANFKLANDRYGHTFGDGMLQATGAMLQASVRSADQLSSRWGGDEFILAVDLTPRQPESVERDDLATLEIIGHRIQQNFQKYLEAEAKDMSGLGITLGYAVYESEFHERAEHVIIAADMDMLGRKATHHAQLGGAHRPSSL